MVATALDEGRLLRLVDRLLSADVQVPEPALANDVPALLSGEEVKQVFKDYVPGVEGFLFRNSRRASLDFVVSAYQEGLRAFRDTPLHGHLQSLLRTVVHHGREGCDGAAEGLREVAEAFMDCQAVQARTIERVGLRICGVAPDFKGLVVRLVGSYKTLAISMLAADRLARGLARDYDQAHTHYENRLTADLGQHLGLDSEAVRLAMLDGHAASRFQPITDADADAAAARCRELFDVVALLQAFVAEANNLSEESHPQSIARLFLDWVAENMAEKHIIFDEATCSRTEISLPLALCIFEALILGAPAAPEHEMHRGKGVCKLFKPCSTSTGPDELLPSVDRVSEAYAGEASEKDTVIDMEEVPKVCVEQLAEPMAAGSTRMPLLAGTRRPRGRGKVARQRR